MIQNIIRHTYKRTRDGWFIFSNAHALANALGWRSLDCFLLFIEEELNTDAYYDLDDHKCYLSADTSISALNNLIMKYYSISQKNHGIC